MGQAQGIPGRSKGLFHSQQRLGRYVNRVVWNGMLYMTKATSLTFSNSSRKRCVAPHYLDFNSSSSVQSGGGQTPRLIMESRLTPGKFSLLRYILRLPPTTLSRNHASTCDSKATHLPTTLSTALPFPEKTPKLLTQNHLMNNLELYKQPCSTK